jgi:hypothetical protein
MRLKILIIIIVLAAAVLFFLTLIYKLVLIRPSVGTGDPGNMRLTELKIDKVFSALPPDARISGPIKEIPAQYRQTYFEPASWSKARVDMTFVSDQPIAAIYKFYEVQAANVGWQLTNNSSNGYAETWTKTYSGNAIETLSLDNVENSPMSHIYKLSGEISPIIH